jgi:hypothetical protein
MGHGGSKCSSHQQSHGVGSTSTRAFCSCGCNPSVIKHERWDHWEMHTSPVCEQLSSFIFVLNSQNSNESHHCHKLCVGSTRTGPAPRDREHTVHHQLNRPCGKSYWINLSKCWLFDRIHSRLLGGISVSSFQGKRRSASQQRSCCRESNATWMQ